MDVSALQNVSYLPVYVKYLAAYSLFEAGLQLSTAMFTELSQVCHMSTAGLAGFMQAFKMHLVLSSIQLLFAIC